MGDRTEDEEERYIRRVARPMPVDPNHLARCLKPHAFTLIYADREEGMNEIRFRRPSSAFKGLFDEVTVKSNIRGEGTSVNAAVSIAPGGWGKTAISQYVPATEYGYEREHHGPKTARDGKRFCTRLADAIPRIFTDLYETRASAFYEQSATARTAAERYLKHLRVTVDLHETFERLKSQATDIQLEKARQYLKRETFTSFGFERDWRIIWEITVLCHVLLWERSEESCLGQVNYRHEESDEIEAHRRMHIVASRLARQPGWPLHDSLVPNRPLHEESIPWRDGKPSLVAELFDEHLAAEDKRCVCGRRFSYLSHNVDADRNPPTATVTIRCNAGHEDNVDMVWNIPASNVD